MIKFLVHRPVAVVVSFVALLLLGASAYTQLPTTLLPDADIPRLSVQVPAENASARMLEQNVLSRLRNALMHMHGLEHLESTSMEGEGRIELLFAHGTNLTLAFLEVNERIDKAMNSLPEGVKRPLVHKASVADIPIFRLNIYPEDSTEARFDELSSFSREIIKRRLEQLTEISMVDITGYSEPQVQIVPRDAYLSTLGISRNRLFQAIAEHELNLGSILVQDGHYQYYLKFNANLLSLEELGNVPINISGRLFKLQDLAEVRMGNAKSDGAFLAGTRRAVNLAVMKQSSAKMDELEIHFDRLLQEMKQDYPNLHFEIVNDQSSLLHFSIRNLQQDLILGGILAFLFMLIFIRKVRAALLIGITVPVTLVLSMLGFYLAGIDLNIISLGGLILGLGMIIDNSIVVIDSINRYKDEGVEDGAEAAVGGTSEIIRPMVTSVLTNCIVFVPLIFLSGIAGVIFFDQALSITVGMMASLLVSVLLLPPLYVMLHKSERTGRFRELKSRVHVTGWYEKGLAITFKYPWAIIGVVGVLLVGSIFFFGKLKKERLPPTSQHDLVLHIDWNQGIALKENERRVQALMLQGQSLITMANAWVGSQQYVFLKDADLGQRAARIYVQVHDLQEVQALKARWERFCQQQYPEAILSFKPGENPLNAIFAHQIAPLRLQLYGRDRGNMPEVDTSRFITDRVTKALPHTFINPVALHDQISLKVRGEEAALYKVSLNDISDALQAVIKPKFIDYFQGSRELVPMVLIGDQIESITRVLQEHTVLNRDGVAIPLAALLKVSNTRDYQRTTAGEAGPFYPIDIQSNQPEKDLKMLHAMEQEEALGPDTEITGSYFSDMELIKEMTGIFLISILLLYFILAAQFESLIQPLFVLVELPIALCGAFFLLYIGGNSLNLMSMIGVVVMGGLIINDSILKIDAINQLRRKGMPLMQAIYEGGHKRLKPIVMITLTSVGALLPTLFMHDLGSELQTPLALALIGGMLLGMLVSLFFVPLIYWYVYKRYEKTEASTT